MNRLLYGKHCAPLILLCELSLIVHSSAFAMIMNGNPRRFPLVPISVFVLANLLVSSFPDFFFGRQIIIFTGPKYSRMLTIILKQNHWLPLQSGRVTLPNCSINPSWEAALYHTLGRCGKGQVPCCMFVELATHIFEQAINYLEIISVKIIAAPLKVFPNSSKRCCDITRRCFRTKQQDDLHQMYPPHQAQPQKAFHRDNGLSAWLFYLACQQWTWLQPQPHPPSQSESVNSV